MLTIPEEIKNLFRSDNTRTKTQKKFKLTFYDDKIDALYPYELLYPDESLFPSEHGEPWLVIENDRIVSESLQILENLCSGEEMIFGSCESSELQITVADVAEDLIGREFTLTVEIGGYEMALGIYTVKSFKRQSDRRKRKITAYDRMSWFNVDVAEWYRDLSFPMTVKTFRDSLCSYIGIQQSETILPFDSLEISKTIEPEQLPGTDVIFAICEINGCFGHVDKTGQLTYVQLQQTGLYPSETLYPEEELFPSEFGGDGMPTETISTYKQPMIYEDYLVEGINGLTIRQEEGDVGASVGENDNVYLIEGNFLVYGKSASDLLSIAETLLPYIAGRVYRPASLDCNCMPWLEVGDAIVVPTRDDVVETFVMKRTITGCQNMRDKIESTGSQRREEDFSIQRQIIQLEGKAAVIVKSVEEVSVRVTDLKNYTESQFKITADAITAEVTRATEAEEVLSGRITVNADNITAEVTRAKSAESSLSASIKIEADRITQEVTDRKNGDTALQSTITQTATQIRSEVKNTADGLQSQITQNANNILLKVSKGEVSSQLSVETGQVTISSNRLVVNSTNFELKSNGDARFSGQITGGTININNVFKVDSSGNTSVTGNHLSWSATNSSMTSDGTLTCKNIKATNGTFSGNVTGSSISGSTIEIGPFYVDDEEIILGDFKVSADNSYQLYSLDGTVSLETSNSPGGSVATLILQNESGSDRAEISGGNPEFTGIVRCRAVYDTAKSYSEFYDINPGKSWWDGWSLTETVQDLWEQVDSLSDETEKENIIDIDADEAMEIILNSRPVTFQYKRDGKWSMGMIAQEVDALQDEKQIFFPLVRTDRRSGKYCINYWGYIPLLISTVRSLQKQIDQLKKGVTS